MAKKTTKKCRMVFPKTLVTPFPTGAPGVATPESTGFSLRDHFAGLAMAGDWSAQSEDAGMFTDEISQQFLDERAKLYYRMADAMLKARES